MHFGIKHSLLGALATCIVGLTIALANADSPRARGGTSTKAEAFIRVGHEDVSPAFRRYVGRVTALGDPDAEGRIHSFQAAQVGRDGIQHVRDNELRGWRLTMLAGNRFASVFEVLSNTESEITVTTLDGPLNGLAVRDVFIIEETAIVRAPSSAQTGRASGI